VDEFSFNFPDEEAQQRQAFRTRIPGLEARLEGWSATFPIKDLSATGLALVDVDARLRQGDEFGLDLLLQGKPLIVGLKAKAMRLLGKGLIGCSFVDVAPRNEAKLDKLILEVQKRIIALKKSKG